jgi:hypothetical protein
MPSPSLTTWTSQYKFAGTFEGSDKWVIGDRVNGTFTNRATLLETVNTGQWYDLEVVIAGVAVTVKVGGVTKATHTFAGGVHGGPVGVQVRNAHSQFDDVWAKEVVSERWYYYFNPLPGTCAGQRVALRKAGVLQYVLGDHPSVAFLAYPAGLPVVAGQVWAARAWC